MLSNYLKIAIRNLLKQKAFSFINITGLAVGIACSLLIGLYVLSELSYDRFHEHSDRIYRVITDFRFGTEGSRTALTAAPIGRSFVENFPEVESFVRLRASRLQGDVTVSSNNKVFNEPRWFYGDSSFFEVFDFPFLAGSPVKALSQPNTVVITKTTAEKYFKAENPVGKVLTLNGRSDYRITGVINDIPISSHFHFEFLAAMSSLNTSSDARWLSNINFHTYIMLNEGAARESLESKIPAFIKDYLGPQIQSGMGISYDELMAQGSRYDLALQPLTEIHLNSHLEYEIEPNGSASNVFIFCAISALILLIAIINFTNLSTSRSSTRALEVGIRKALGSSRAGLIRQFLAEAVLTSSIAMILAVTLVELSLPVFETLAGKPIDSSHLGSLTAISGLLGFSIFLGLTAGIYPAFFITSLRPSSSLKVKSIAGGGRGRFRNALVILQFSISIVLIVGSFVVQDQLQYFQSKNLGFDKEHVVVIKNASMLGQKQMSFKNDLLISPQIISAAYSSTIPGENYGRELYKPEGQPIGSASPMFFCFSDYDFVRTFEMELVDGRDFSPESGNNSNAILINEAAARSLGWDDPVGRTLESGRIWTVIGVIKDFHFESLHQTIRPLVVQHRKESNQYLSIRINGDNIREAIAFLERKWMDFVDDRPLEFAFLDQDFDSLYQSEQRAGRIVTIFSILSIFIAFLGLVGLASFTTQQRTKEIGVRKVLGASVMNVTVLLTREFARNVLLANIIAWPVAWFGMNKWLENFAYRIEISWRVFVAAGFLALMVALITVSTQVVKAAIANPVESLRYE